MMMASEWRSAKLGELVSFKTGKLDSNAAVPDGDYPFFTCSQDTFRTNTYSFDTECVLLGGNNANGIFPLKYFKGKFDAYQRTYVIKPRDSEQLTTKFLYYALRPKLSELRSFSTGAATKFLTLTILNETAIEIPSLDEQHRIAGILSTYDELIENNQRRIRILEDMACNLYREWFVHFRYPGHESAPLVDSPLGQIPLGWEVKKLKEVCNLTMGSSPKSEFYNETGDGLPFHQGVTNFGDRFPTDRLFCTVESRIAEAGDILFSVRAPVGRMNITDKKIIIGRGLSAIHHKAGHQAFLWEQLRAKFTEEDMMGNGAIFASVTKDDMQGIELLCPAEQIIKAATRYFKPLHAEIEVLIKQTANLRHTRDLLLPRLLSGQIVLIKST
ncbi:MAG: restriction endonuclease subunit S [Gallionella sp.]|nr:restriction endonuclease subunit S [Gallionella sp.]